MHFTSFSAFLIAGAFATSVFAQSLPDEAGPSLDHQSSTSQQERITNPSGFGKSPDARTIDPGHTGSTGGVDCRQQKDIRTERSAEVTESMDCIR